MQFSSKAYKDCHIERLQTVADLFTLLLINISTNDSVFCLYKLSFGANCMPLH